MFFFTIKAKNIKVVFRYDDFRLEHNLLNENIVNVFQKNNIPLVLGVIPCDYDENIISGKHYSFFTKLQKGVQSKSIEIALHGLTHSKLLYGEFGGVYKDEQFRRINKGKEILDSIFNIKLETFIPPFNAYDENTLDVLNKVGIKGISSALCVNQPVSNSNITYFPCTVSDLNLLNSVLHENINRNVVVVVMFHDYDFDKLYSLPKLETLLSSINSMNNVKCYSFSQLYKEKEISDGKRISSNMESNFLYKHLKLKDAIQTTEFSNLIRRLNLLLYLTVCILTFLLTIFLIDSKKEVLIIKYFINIIMLIIIVSLSVWFHALSPIKLLLYLLVISTVLPIELKILNHKH